MPCYFPLQAVFSERSDGKKDVQFSKSAGLLFRNGLDPVGENYFCLPCGRCMGCRLERSRQWALRCFHESKLYEDNCFVTLTFSDENLLKMCPGMPSNGLGDEEAPFPSGYPVRAAVSLEGHEQQEKSVYFPGPDQV